MASVSLGVDIAKATFDVALLKTNKTYKHKKFLNHSAGFEALKNWLDKQDDTADWWICMEATGAYWQALATFLSEANYRVSVINPAKIKAFGQSRLARNKTDKIDAGLIADYCTMYPELKLWHPPEPHVRTLQSLVRRTDSLQKMLIQEKLRLDTSDSCVKPSLEKMIDVLENELKTIRETIKSQLQQNEDFRKKRDLIMSIPGVGEITIAWVLAFMSDHHAFENAKKLTAFVGLNPRHRQSGTSLNGKTYLSKVGDAQLRKMLYMPAIVIIE